MELVTVGMPVFNGASFLRQTIESILTQTYPNIRLVISDNASTDSTHDICKHYESIDSRVQYFRQPYNIGPANNFKFVFNESNSSYFMWAAADDLWDSDWIERLLPICIKNNCFAFGSVVSIDSHNRIIRTMSNGRSFVFSGCRFKRRISYCLQIPSLGKANLIYALFPVSAISPCHLDILESQTHYADVLFIFSMLGALEALAPIQSVSLYKRLSPSEVQQALPNLKHIVAFSKYTIRILLRSFIQPIRQFLLHCPFLLSSELLAWFILLPFAICLSIFCRLRYVTASLSDWKSNPGS